MNVDKEILKIQKRLIKVAKRLFGLTDSFPKLYEYTFSKMTSLEKKAGKPIGEFTEEDIRTYSLSYSIWKAMDKTYRAYLLLTELRCFDVREMHDEFMKFAKECLDGRKGIRED